jgi:hypothetical protein
MVPGFSCQSTTFRPLIKAFQYFRILYRIRGEICEYALTPLRYVAQRGVKTPLMSHCAKSILHRGQID